MNKALLLLVILLQLSVINLVAQNSSGTEDSEKFNRWSASLYGGYIFGERDQGQQIFASRFNVVSEPTYAFGTDVRYALIPFWSMEAGYRYSYLEGVGFETTMHTVSIKNTFNLNRLYRRSGLAGTLNPYVILGVEQDFFDAEGPDDSFSRSEASLIGGLGLAVRVSDRIELYGQHEIKLSSNHLDLANRGYPYDQIGMASGGIRIHFGSKSKKPLNLAPPKKSLTENEYEDFASEIARIDDLERDLAALTGRVDTLESRMDRMEMSNDQKFTNLFALIDSLQARADSLEECMCVSEQEQMVQETDTRELRRDVPAGHYVQVFASQDYDDALSIRNRFRELLSNRLENPEEDVFIIVRRQYYEVLIGTFQQFSAAQQILPPAVNEMSDAFVITFPRPAHLQEQYEGTTIIYQE
ncbi:hypothetical protein [Rhodohalobacter sp. 8-1]|uniref:hypothetical protein n=1 Tax=Rhodohalobacter sp. 8-1 TaxID=3131972 RepID=UPI0030EE91C5